MRRCGGGGEEEERKRAEARIRKTVGSWEWRVERKGEPIKILGFLDEMAKSSMAVLLRALLKASGCF